MKSSFVRKGKAAGASGTPPALPVGTRLSAHNGALQMSSGLAELDGEGIVCQQDIHISVVSSEEDGLEKWIKKLGACTGSPPSSSIPTSSQSQQSTLSQQPQQPQKSQKSYEDDMEDMGASLKAGNDAPQQGDDGIKIAWQYKKYLGEEKGGTMGGSGRKSVAWCHSFDMSRSIDPSTLSSPQTNVQLYSIKPSHYTAGVVVNSKTPTSDPYQRIYNELNKFIQEHNEDMKERMKRGEPAKISRLVIKDMGSPLFAASFETPQHHVSCLIQFLRALRGLLRQSLATCVVSFPAHLFAAVDPKLSSSQTSNTLILDKIRHSADAVVQFSAFTDSEAPVSPAFADHDGIFTLLKLFKINSLVSNMPAQPSFTFQFKRKKLYIEKIHLPPDLSILESAQKSNKKSSIDDEISIRDQSSHQHTADCNHSSHSTSTSQSSNSKVSSMLCSPNVQKSSQLDF